jgi:hypothetical protein
VVALERAPVDGIFPPLVQKTSPVLSISRKNKNGRKKLEFKPKLKTAILPNTVQERCVNSINAYTNVFWAKTMKLLFHICARMYFCQRILCWNFRTIYGG